MWTDFVKWLREWWIAVQIVIFVDLADVEFIDSAGLGMLLLARDEISKKSSSLTLKSPQGQVQRMFSVARFEQMFDIDNNQKPDPE
ncbi:MAG: anti-anti-sigma factor [Alphaproteobacteria bacterium]|nr:MAG: anti-anti-sigma factor [Alphaproteobacteria bacterium]